MEKSTQLTGRSASADQSWFKARAAQAGRLARPPADPSPTHHPGEDDPAGAVVFEELAAAVRDKAALGDDVAPPTLEELAGELAAGRMEQDALTECSRRILGQLIGIAKTIAGKGERAECSRLCYEGLRVNEEGLGEETARAALEAVCGSWALSGGNREAMLDTHPVVPLVREWFIQKGAVEPANVKRGAMLPAFHRARPDEAGTKRLLVFDSEPEPGDQLALPLGLGGRNGGACPAWLLELFDAAGGRSFASGGSGAPWVLRLFVGAILHAPYAARDGNGHWLVMPAPNVIRWIHPEGWKNQKRRWQQFPDALSQLEQLRVTIPGRFRLRLVAVDGMPDGPDGLVAFRFLIPTGAASGARVDWSALCEYGRESSALYRAYLSSSAVLDHTARKGEPARARGGQLEKMVPTFTADELARMAGYSGYRTSRQRALAAFQRLSEDGAIDLQPFGNGWRILGPRAA